MKVQTFFLKDPKFFNNAMKLMVFPAEFKLVLF